eukprot:SAG11_NODE_1515_length_4766_cov_3.591172_4_plen_172_part_00
MRFALASPHLWVTGLYILLLTLPIDGLKVVLRFLMIFTYSSWLGNLHLSDTEPRDVLSSNSRINKVFARCTPEEVEVMSMSGWSNPSTFIVSAVDTDEEQVEFLTTEKLGPVSPLTAQVKSVPNIMEPHEIVTLKSKITYPSGSFARKVFDRWHGKASAEDVRATNVHFPL